MLIVISGFLGTASLSLCLLLSGQVRPFPSHTAPHPRFHKRIIRMELQNLLNLIASLPKEHQEAVEEFVHYIQQQPARPTMNFREALDTFVQQYP